MKCAIYRAVGKYEEGLLFIRLEDEQKWLSAEDTNYTLPFEQQIFPNPKSFDFKRLGEMEVDASVIPFHTQPEKPKSKDAVLLADFTYEG